MNFKYLSAAALAIGIASPAIAQDVAAPSSAATVEAGTTIYGSDGAAIGTVARAEGEGDERRTEPGIRKRQGA